MWTNYYFLGCLGFGRRSGTCLSACWLNLMKSCVALLRCWVSVISLLMVASEARLCSSSLTSRASNTVGRCLIIFLSSRRSYFSVVVFHSVWKSHGKATDPARSGGFALHSNQLGLIDCSSCRVDLVRKWRVRSLAEMMSLVRFVNLLTVDQFVLVSPKSEI